MVSIISCLSSGGGVFPISLSQIGSLNNTTYGFCILDEAFYRIDILSGQAAALYIYERTATRETLSGRAADLYIYERTATRETLTGRAADHYIRTATYTFFCFFLQGPHVEHSTYGIDCVKSCLCTEPRQRKCYVCIKLSFMSESICITTIGC